MSCFKCQFLPPRPMHKDQPIPVLFRTDWYRMDPIAPDKADPKQLQALRKKMLSYYVPAKHLYVTQTYRRNAAARANRAAPVPN